MNIKEYIASGIIESYVLGLASEKEKAEFEKLCKQYPELKEARIDFELALEEEAFSHIAKQNPDLKEKILESIRQESAVMTANQIIAAKPGAVVRSLPRMKWAIAASVALLIGVSSIIFVLYNQNKKLENEVAKSKSQQLHQLQQNAELPENSIVQQVKVETPKNIPASINVFWDSTNTNVYLVIRDLVKLPANQKYELWSLNKGKYSSLGLFDAPNDDRLILKLNNSQDAEAFSVSIAEIKKEEEQTVSEEKK